MQMTPFRKPFRASPALPQKRFTVISFSDCLHPEGNSLSKILLIVTVDDGYRDFAEVAMPLLKKYEVPATPFVTTRFVDREICCRTL
jgi:peptidoglycan/xylan/chitin deacetylase (PgdA/CDA1 family)